MNMPSAWSFWQVLDAHSFPATNQELKMQLHTQISACLVEANVETETYETVDPGKDFLYIWKRQARAHDSHCQCETLFKSQTCPEPPPRVPSASSSPTKACIEPCTSTKGSLDGCEAKPGALAGRAASTCPLTVSICTQQA